METQRHFPDTQVALKHLHVGHKSKGILETPLLIINLAHWQSNFFRG